MTNEMKEQMKRYEDFIENRLKPDLNITIQEKARIQTELNKL